MKFERLYENRKKKKEKNEWKIYNEIKKEKKGRLTSNGLKGEYQTREVRLLIVFMHNSRSILSVVSFKTHLNTDSDLPYRSSDTSGGRSGLSLLKGQFTRKTVDVAAAVVDKKREKKKRKKKEMHFWKTKLFLRTRS